VPEIWASLLILSKPAKYLKKIFISILIEGKIITLRKEYFMKHVRLDPDGKKPLNAKFVMFTLILWKT
jgi:hypothetical protein